MSVTTDPIPSIAVNGMSLEVIDRGAGRPTLFLHPGIGLDPQSPVLEQLARGGRVLAPFHPGFGSTPAPKSITTVSDISYLYLDLMEAYDLRDTLVVGVGLGAWIAAEIAIKSTERISSLVLANAIGIKVGDRETRDIPDIWAITAQQFDELAYFDPNVAKRDYKALPEGVAFAAARAREANARYCWSPYMHNPKLKNWLHRIRIPTLCLWGTADRIVSESYARAFCAAIPGAQFETIERAGHFPHVEQPEEFARRTLAFGSPKAEAAQRTA
jgi:pimeloyl-ACP methyl ester carboxylesterase